MIEWRARADAWFKLLGAIALAYVIIARIVAYLAQFGDVTLIAIGGILLAYFVYPAVHWLNARMPLWLALTATYCGGMLIFFGLLTILAVPIASQAQSLTQQLPEIEGKVADVLENPKNPYMQRIPAPVRGYVVKLPNEVQSMVRNNVASITNSAAKVFLSVAALGAILIAVPVVSIYMLAESPMIKRYFLERVPDRHRTKARRVLAEIDSVVGGFIRGQLIVAACVAVLVSVALLALGLPYAVLIGVWSGLADIIPYIGPFAGAIPAVLVAAFAGSWLKVAAVILALVLVNQVEGHLLSPRIVGKTVQITPLVVIFTLLIGGSMYGIVGLILAVPVAGIIRVLVEEFIPVRELRTIDVRPGLTQDARDHVEPHAKAD